MRGEGESDDAQRARKESPSATDQSRADDAEKRGRGGIDPGRPTGEGNMGNDG